MSLTEKHKRLGNMTGFMDYNLADLKKKINEARTIAGQVSLILWEVLSHTALAINQSTLFWWVKILPFGTILDKHFF